jgi:alpha-beta hydrolase superfamily lysophospholipase
MALQSNRAAGDIDESYRWATTIEKEEDASPWAAEGRVLEWTLSETANDSTYREKMRKCRSFFLSGQGGHFTGAAGVRIEYRLFENESAKAACMILTGWNENLLKYKETIYDLHSRGLAVFIMDHQCQGLSGRLTHKCANWQLSYIESFGDYVSDALHFARKFVSPRLSGKRLGVLAHSMGGLVATHAALRERVTNTPPEERFFTRLALCAPFMGFEHPYPDFVILGMACALTLVGKAATHVPGDTTLDPAHPQPSGTRCSHHAGRTWHTQRIRELVPQVITCSPSVAWVRRCILAHLRLFQQAHKLGNSWGDYDPAGKGGTVDTHAACSILRTTTRRRDVDTAAAG